jgi:hypothetical protein
VVSARMAAVKRTVRSRGFLAGAAVLACVVTAALAADKADVSDLTPQDITVSARPISFASAQPEKRDFGALTFIGGLVLSSTSSYFGGYSGLALDAKGERLLTISDSGSWLSGKLDYKDGVPSGISDARIGPIPAKNGKPLKKGERDVESIVALKVGGIEGRYLLGFERRHRIEEYAFEKGEMRGPLGKRAIPDQLKGMKSNGGLEDLTILRGGPYAGAMVTFSEKMLTDDGRHTGALVKDGKSQSLFMKRYEEFDITDMQSTSDGSLVVLERSFNPALLRVGTRMRLIKAADVKPGATLDGQLLLEAGPGLEIDNFEGLAITENDKREIVLTIISDDNFNFIQRTLLMQFKIK